MLCPLCHGRRLFLLQGQLVPCPECEGQGEIYCCDGLQEQPEDELNDGEPGAPATGEAESSDR
jgi:hypothetical protein